MINLSLTSRLFVTTILCSGIFACASTPEPDTRPALIISAEKSLELGVSNYTRNDFIKAQHHFERALFLYRNIDNPNGITSSYLNLAKTQLATGQTDAARDYTEKAQIVIMREQLRIFDHNLSLIKSSIAIEKEELSQAKQKLDKLLNSAINNNAIKTAVLQNRTRIALAENDSNAQEWIKKYENSLSNNGQNSALNKARLLRFKALLKKEAATEKLHKALDLYREVAHSPGIAATLTEWAAVNTENKDYKNAVNKLQRALFIRSNLHDRKNTKKILQQLASNYNKLGEAKKENRTNYWLKKLENKNFSEWDAATYDD
jgi:tetratricopeptide (TPR) repeat protein